MLTAVAGSATGTWTASAGRLSGSPAAGSDTAIQLLNLGGISQVPSATLLEVSGTFRTAARAGLVFDRYSDTDFKFAAIDVSTKQVLIGHRKGSSWTIDAAVTNTGLNATTDYKLGVSIKGSSVSLTLNDQPVLGFVFNSLASDGRFGLFARTSTASFDTITVRTNDASVSVALSPATAPALLLAAAPPSTDTTAGTTTTASSLSDEQLKPLIAAAIARLRPILDPATLQRLRRTTVRITDLPGLELGSYADGVISIDRDAAGHGWFIDLTPRRDEEYRSLGGSLVAIIAPAAGGIDLLSVLMHEFGHAAGLEHTASGVMAESLDVGIRSLGEVTPVTIHSHGDSSISASPYGSSRASTPTLFGVGSATGKAVSTPETNGIESLLQTRHHAHEVSGSWKGLSRWFRRFR
jgi:hypothetical protein